MLMKRIIGAFLAVAALAVGLTFAAPAPDVHADPNPLCAAAGWGDNPICNNIVSIVAPASTAAAPAAAAASQVVDFVKNPLSYISAAVIGAATFVLARVAEFANASTAPDLSLDFWKKAYAQGWAIGLVLFCGVLLWEFGNFALRRITPSQFGATLAIWAPATLGAMMFAPMLAQTVVQGAAYLADGLIQHMGGYGGSDAFNAIDKSIQNGNVFGSGVQGPIQGMLGIVFGLLMLVSAVLVYVSLAFQGLVLYLSTAAMAMGLAWMASTGTRKHSFSIPRMVIAICLGKITLIFTLGVVLAMATAATAITGDGVGKDFGLVVMAIIGMLLSAFVPMILLKHSPAMPGMAAAVGVGMAGVGSAAAWTAASAGSRAAGRGASAGGSKLSGAVKSGRADVAGMVARKGRKVQTPGDGRLSQSTSGRTIDAPVPGGDGNSNPGREGSGSAAGSAAARRASGMNATPTPGTQPGDAPPTGYQRPKPWKPPWEKGKGGGTSNRAPFVADTSQPGWQTKIPWTDGKRADHPMHSGSKLNGAVSRTPPRTPPSGGTA